MDINLAVFCHIGNYDIWIKMKDHFKKINVKYDFYINISDIVDYNKKHLIKNDTDFEYKHIFELPNKGCDIGPFFKFITFLKNNDINYKYILNTHTKTDDNWRNEMISFFCDDTQNVINIMKQEGDSVLGAYTSQYDYFNIYYDIYFLDKTKNKYINNWNYINNNENDNNENDNNNNDNDDNDIMKKVEYLIKNKKEILYSPDIHIDLYEKFFNINKVNKYMQPDNIYKMKIFVKNIITDINKLYYYPGTYMMFNYEQLNCSFKNFDFEEIYNELEDGKPDDKLIQSKTHSLERILAINFQIYNRLYDYVDKAIYGNKNDNIDVTDILNLLIDSGSTYFKVCNNLFSDPCNGLEKRLVVYTGSEIKQFLENSKVFIIKK